jgi:hypothetical protein
MISLATPSRKVIHLCAGDPVATAPHTRSPVSIRTTAVFSPLFRGLPPRTRAHPYRPSNSVQPPILAMPARLIHIVAAEASGAPLPAISCLGASPTPAVGARGRRHHAGVRETFTAADSCSAAKCVYRWRRRYGVGSAPREDSAGRSGLHRSALSWALRIERSNCGLRAAQISYLPGHCMKN